MKLLLTLVGFVLLVNHGINADQALVQRLKPYEKYSPYEWTKWLELRPPQGQQPVAAAAVAYAPYGYQPAARPPPPSDSDELTESDEETEDDDEYGDSINPFNQWFKRAILPAPPSKKTKKLKDPNATKKPSIVDVPLDYWGPPPSVAPNVTLPPPPGYWAAKKSMFISKLFAALATSVLNATGPPALAGDITTTTVSPKQAILDEIESVLLSDVARSVTTAESEEDSDEADDDSEEEEEVAETTTVNPFLLKKADFIQKLTAAILSQPQAAAPAPAATAAPAPVAAPKPKPTKPAPAPVTKKPAKAGKGGKKAKADKKAPKLPKYLKYIPTTTTTTTPVPPPTIDYDALAKALLGGSSK